MKPNSDIFATTLSDFRSCLKLERSLSDNTIAGYNSDCSKFFAFLKEKDVISPEAASSEDISEYLAQVTSAGLSKRSQARLVSSLKALYRFLESEGRLKDNPATGLIPLNREDIFLRCFSRGGGAYSRLFRPFEKRRTAQ